MTIFKIITPFIVLLLMLNACSKEKNTVFPNLPKEGTYFTDHIWVTPVLDLNRDGKASDDLLEEIHWVQNKFHFGLTVDNREQQDYRFFDFGYPYLYTDPNDPNFLNLGSNSIYSNFKLEGNKLITENPAILSAILLNDSTIEITSIAEFELVEGNKEVEMKAVYTWSSL